MGYGEKNLEFFTDGFRKKKVVAQVADVRMVLISADTLTQVGNEVNLSKGWLHIRHPSGEVTPLIRRGGGVFMMNMWFQRPPSEEGFTRQGA